VADTDLVLTHALITALGWMLVHFLWQGCVLAGLFWLVCVLSSRENSDLRYWAGICGFFLSLASLFITFACYYNPEARFASAPVQSQAINPFLVLSGRWPDTGFLLQQGLEPALPVVVLLWLTGVLIQSAQAAYGWVVIRRLIRSGTTDIGTSLRSVIGDLQQLLGVRSKVRILKTALIRVPMAVGWFKPLILLPASVLVQLPRDQLEMIIAHELGHIRRYDHLFNLFQIFMETLLFYHPAIAWMSNRVRQERENCCDDLVVACCNKPATYARALASLEVMRGRANTLALAAAGGDLLARIKRIIDHELPRTRSGYVQISFLFLVTLCVALGAHQGMLLSDQLNRVAGSVRLQVSDVEWKTRNTSRAAWASGMQNFAASVVAEVPDEPVRPRRQVAEAIDVIHDQAKSTPTPAPKPTRLVLPEPIAESFMPVQERVAAGPVAQVPKLPVAQPTPVHTTFPKYPWRARTKGIEGFVELAFSLDREGHVVDIEVVDSLPEGIFDQAATRALQKWKFAESGGSGKPQRLLQKFDFTLEERTVQAPLARNCVTAGHRACKRIPANAVVVYVNPPQETETLSRVN